MTIDLTDLINSLIPDPIAIVIDGRSHPLGHTSVAQVFRLQAAAAKTDEELIESLAAVFGEDLPAVLVEARESFARGDAAPLEERTRVRHHLSFLYVATLAVVAEAAKPKKLETATEALSARIAALSASSTRSAD